MTKQQLNKELKKVDKIVIEIGNQYAVMSTLKNIPTVFRKYNKAVSLDSILADFI